MHYKTVKGILSASNNMNIFRGCEHGCIYCDSRSACYQINHDFEDIEVKENALLLLETELKKRRKKAMISTGSMCDPYTPVEEKLLYTRRAFELIEKYGFGLSVQTKSSLILRDLDLLKRIHRKSRCVVSITVTAMEDTLAKKIEPNVSPTSERIDVLKVLKREGIPAIVWLSPVLPFLTDTEENISSIIRACAENGVYGIVNFGMGVTMREGNREYFYDCLNRLFPGLSAKYAKAYGNSYECLSPNADALSKLFFDQCKRFGLCADFDKLFRFMREFPENAVQLSMWE